MPREYSEYNTTCRYIHGVIVSCKKGNLGGGPRVDKEIPARVPSAVQPSYDIDIDFPDFAKFLYVEGNWWRVQEQLVKTISARIFEPK